MSLSGWAHRQQSHQANKLRPRLSYRKTPPLSTVEQPETGVSLTVRDLDYMFKPKFVTIPALSIICDGKGNTYKIE